MSNKSYTLEDFFRDGLSRNLPDQYFDQNQLLKGIEVEFEHTQNSDLAKKIAKDHLVEIPDYYNRLERMEEKAKKYWTDQRYSQTSIGRYLNWK